MCVESSEWVLCLLVWGLHTPASNLDMSLENRSSHSPRWGLPIKSMSSCQWKGIIQELLMSQHHCGVADGSIPPDVLPSMFYRRGITKPFWLCGYCIYFRYFFAHIVNMNLPYDKNVFSVNYFWLSSARKSHLKVYYFSEPETPAKGFEFTAVKLATPLTLWIRSNNRALGTILKKLL